jgi:enoyl-[acyl-carrier protein] reductase I
MGFLGGKKALVVGLASNRSIAWGIAKAMRAQGADLALTYQNERLEERVKKLGAELDCEIALPCDLSEDTEVEATFAALGNSWDGVDIVVHSAAFAPREELEGDYVDNVTREGSRIAHDVSSYSFAALAKYARPMMKGRNGALLTLTYLGAVRAMPNYNVMGPAKASLESNVRYMALSLGPEGTRVNAISAGPIRTLAAAGIAGFRRILSHVEENAPLKRNVTIEEVGNTAAFLCSDLASGVTGEIVHVDAGFNIAGMSFE